VWQLLGERLQAQPRVGLQRDTKRLGRIEWVHVERDEPGLGEERIGSGSKVRQAGAYSEDQIGVTGQGIRCGRAGDPDRPELKWMVPGQRALASLRLANRHTVTLGKPAQGLAGPAVKHSASRNDHRALVCDHYALRSVKLCLAGRRCSKFDLRTLKKLIVIVEGIGLHILRWREGHRPPEQGIRQ